VRHERKAADFAGTVQGEKRLPARGFSEGKHPKIYRFAGLQAHAPLFFGKKKGEEEKEKKYLFLPAVPAILQT
jgi:hypothetical protein